MKWFQKRRGLAAGLTAAGFGAGAALTVVPLTRSLAATTARDGITVNLMSPGWTNTTLIDWNRIAKGRGVSIDAAQEAAKADSLQHRILEPEELAPMAVLLASPDGGGITGQMINVDGGYRV